MTAEQRIFVDRVKTSIRLMTGEQIEEIRSLLKEIDRRDLGGASSGMTREQKRKAISMLHAAEAANEHASLALMDCHLQPSHAWMQAYGAPMHVVMEHQAHRARKIREWLESKEVSDGNNG